MGKDDKNNDTTINTENSATQEKNTSEESRANKVNGKAEQPNGQQPEQHEKASATKQKPTKAKGKKETEKLKNEIDRLRDQYLRKVAEFDNFRKRKEKELIDAYGFANAEFVKKILPVLDDLDRTVESAKNDQKYEALVQGLELVHKAFLKILEDEGVEVIDAIGEEFNPEYHDALLQMEKEGVDSNVVIDQSQKGYKIGDRILRPAKVVVSK